MRGNRACFHEMHSICATPFLELLTPRHAAECSFGVAQRIMTELSPRIIVSPQQKHVTTAFCMFSVISGLRP